MPQYLYGAAFYFVFSGVGVVSVSVRGNGSVPASLSSIAHISIIESAESTNSTSTVHSLYFSRIRNSSSVGPSSPHRHSAWGWQPNPIISYDSGRKRQTFGSAEEQSRGLFLFPLVSDSSGYGYCFGHLVLQTHLMDVGRTRSLSPHEPKIDKEPAYSR
jgi:hypothetical protein